MCIVLTVLTSAVWDFVTVAWKVMSSWNRDGHLENRVKVRSSLQTLRQCMEKADCIEYKGYVARSLMWLCQASSCTCTSYRARGAGIFFSTHLLFSRSHIWPCTEPCWSVLGLRYSADEDMESLCMVSTGMPNLLKEAHLSYHYQTFFIMRIFSCISLLPVRAALRFFLCAPPSFTIAYVAIPVSMYSSYASHSTNWKKKLHFVTNQAWRRENVQKEWVATRA